jgi:XRCC1 domain-containing protein
MRKRITKQENGTVSVANQQWLNVEYLAQVEVSSEDEAHPIESALASAGRGWRAGQPGQQTVRLLFDEPQRVRHIHVGFQEDEHQRTQEFVLRWSADGGQSYQEIVRQQYNFSPPGTTSESEDYDVQLDQMTALELTIVPDISGAPVCASLAQLRLT